MSKRKIFWLHSHTLLSTGGTRFIHEVAARLSNKYDIELIVEKSSMQWKKAFEDSNIKVTEIGIITSTSLFYWLFFPIFLFINYFKLKKLLNSQDIVISTMFPFNFLGSLLSKGHIYYCFEPFAFFYDNELMKQGGNIKYQLLILLKNLYHGFDYVGTRSASMVLAINPSVGAYIKKIYKILPKDFTYLGVDTNHFKPVKVMHEKKLVFFHSTDYTLLKGTQYLIASLGLISQYKDKFKIIISDSITNPKIKKGFMKEVENLKLQDTVKFIGHVSYQDLPKYYSLADCYLFLGSPASQGASAASLSVLEAQSCGLPVIRSIGNKDEILHGKTGFYIDPRKKMEFAKLLTILIKNPKKITNLSKNCRQRIVTKYTWQKVAKTFIKNIEAMINS